VATTGKKKGTSLAKGPIGLIGLVLLAYGITALIFGGHSFAQHAPQGTVHGKTWIGLEVNAWSGLLFIAAGLLLLLAAPLHWAAKGLSLIVGLALAVAALIALADRHGALGIFAANHLTELVWGAAAVLLIAFSALPRVGAKTKQPYDGRAERLGSTPRTEPAPWSVEREPARARTVRIEHQIPSATADGIAVAANGTGTAVPAATRSDPAIPANGTDIRRPVTTPTSRPTLDLPRRSTSTQTKEKQHV
jgi:hypothetical protein